MIGGTIKEHFNLGVGYGSVVEFVFSMHKFLGSIPSTATDQNQPKPNQNKTKPVKSDMKL